MELFFEGEKDNETASVIAYTNPLYHLELRKIVVRVDPINYRPTEVNVLIRDPSKSKKIGWEPQYDLASLVKEMVLSDLNLI